MPSRISFVDLDSAVYAAASSAQSRIACEGGMLVPVSDVEQAKALLDAAISDIKKQVGGRVVCFLNDLGGNWRREVLPSYKSNRDPSKRPMAFMAVREYAESAHGATWFPLLEADDAVGMHGGGSALNVMVSIDKDLDTVPGMHYNPMKPERGIYRVDEAEADRAHLVQTVLGDPVDGYGGAKGFGKKKLEGYLTTHVLTWASVVDIFSKVHMTEAEAIQQAQVAHILRSKREYVPRNGTVKLWRPK